MSEKPRLRVCVMVLGDVGRSPRMQYHAFALASRLADVDVVGYAGSAAHRTIREHPHIRWHLLRAPWQLQRQHMPHVLFLGYALCKVLCESLQLLWVLLCVIAKPNVVLVQNPPAVPTLLLAWAVARLRGARLVIDWHNFSSSMLTLRFGRAHPVVGLTQWFECAMGRHADAHLCVSRAMHVELTVRWELSRVVVFHDRPAAIFAPTLSSRRHDLFCRLQDTIALPAVMCDPRAREQPAVIVSPTSWTADEDFSLLLNAVQQYEEMMYQHEPGTRGHTLPPLLILITGQGPLRPYYEQQIKRLALQRIHLRTLWLSAEDYPLLLGSADLGVCVHRSASGLDLPMKVVDMFGAGVPVCALDYGPCLAEQVRHGENGLLFSNSMQLAALLYDLFNGFPHETPLLDQLRHNVRACRGESWVDAWEQHVLPIFTAP